MLDKEISLQALREFTDCFYPVWSWKLDRFFNVIQSDCTHESLIRSVFLRDGRRDAIEAHMNTSGSPRAASRSECICSHPPGTDAALLRSGRKNRPQPDCLLFLPAEAGKGEGQGGSRPVYKNQRTVECGAGAAGTGKVSAGEYPDHCG